MKNMYLMIGPSGAGKSTLAQKIVNTTDEPIKIFSYDKFRLDWYNGATYNECFELACADPEFNNKCWAKFMELLNEGVGIIIDNVNLTAKSRSKFLKQADTFGYKKVAVVFDIPKEELLERQANRIGKNLSARVVYQHLDALQLPIDNEFDIVYNSTEL